MDIRFLIEQLDEISRRGFLTGLGAAGAGYMLGKADDDKAEKSKTEPTKPTKPADPWNVHTNTDSLEGTDTGQSGYVQSTDGLATLGLSIFTKYGKSVSINIERDTIDNYSIGARKPEGRIKFGDKPATRIQLEVYRSYQGALIYADYDLFDKIVSYNGTIKIEIPLRREGDQIFTFNVRPTKGFEVNKTPREKPIEESSAEAIARIVELSKK